MKFRELLYENSVKGTETLKKDKSDKDEINIFTVIDQICLKKTKYPYSQLKKIASGWALTSWFGQDTSLIGIVQEMNKIQFSLPDEAIYNYYFHEIPKGKRWIKWPKKDHVLLKKESEIEEFMIIHDMSKREAQMIFSFKERLDQKSK